VPLALSLPVEGAIALAAFIAIVVVLGLLSPSSGADLLDFNPERTAERKASAEAEDEEQFLALQNRMRASRGQHPLTDEEVARGVAHDIGDPRGEKSPD
jgi:hypothetical protein